MLLNSSLLFFFLECNFSLKLDKIVICLLKLVLSILSFLPAVKLLKFLSFELFLNLLLNELALKLILFKLLDEGHLVVFELILDDLGISHLFLVFFL